MTTAAPEKPATTIWTCPSCDSEIPVGAKTLEYLKSGEVRVCTCDVRPPALKVPS